MKLRNWWTPHLLGIVAVMFTLACSGNELTPARETATLVPPPTATVASTAKPSAAAAPRTPTLTATAAPTATNTPTATLWPTATAMVAPTTAPNLTVTSTPTPAAVPGNPAVLEGRWEGVDILPGGGQLPFIVTFYVSGDGLQGIMDIPDQGAFGLDLSELVFQSGRLHFELETPIGLAVWDGELDDEVIEGDFSQAGLEGKFRLQRPSVIGTVVPAQEAVAPYHQEETVFANRDIVLAGSLTLPDADGPHPAVVLISGSGAQDRDSNLFGFKTFAIIADHLARHGVAVLRFDDRGAGGSTGNVMLATIQDRAEDVMAAVELLRARDDINPNMIGLIGHSEGGIIAPMAASQRDGIAFAVLLAAPAVTGDTILRAQLVEILKADGATAEQIELAQAQQDLTLRAVATGKGWDEVEAAARQTALEQIKALPEAWRDAIVDIDIYLDTIIGQQIKFAQSPWYKSFYEYDPAPAAQALTIPVLALYGELDTQVPAAMNAAALSEALAESDSPDFTIMTLPGANHLFQEAVTGSPSEYAELKQEFVSGFLESIREWILRQADSP